MGVLFDTQDYEISTRALKTERRIEFTLSEMDRLISKLKGNEIKVFIYMKYMFFKSIEGLYYENKEEISKKNKNKYYEKLKEEGKMLKKEQLEELRTKIKSLRTEGFKNKDICLELNLPIKTLERHITYLKKNGLL